MKVLIITENGAAWPSGFVRALIYRDEFARAGWQATFVSRRSERLTRLIESQHPFGRRLLSLGGGRIIASLNEALAKSRAARFAKMSAVSDAVYLQKIGSYELVSRVRASARGRVVYDLNDGLWLPQWASFLSCRLNEVLGSMDAVTCDNAYGLAYAQTVARKAHLVPDSPQVEAFDAVRGTIARPTEPKIIGWVGSRNTAGNLFLIWEALEELCGRRSDFELRFLGTDRHNPASPRFERVPATFLPRYGQSEMIREVLRMQIGLFPLFDVEDSRARGVLKATVYMSGGACVLASPVGQCRDLIKPGQNGFLPNSRSEWIESLERLLDDEHLQESVRVRALADVRASYSLESCFAALTEALSGRPA
jgi:glycosyltransferase involved in cell wall biosynthesis